MVHKHAKLEHDETQSPGPLPAATQLVLNLVVFCCNRIQSGVGSRDVAADDFT